MTTTDQMKEALRNTRQTTAFACGGNDETDVERTAGEWLAAGFTAAQCGAWLEAGCFAADDARKLADAGLTPDDVSCDCPTLPGYSWGYAYANGDTSLAKVAAACKVN